ncbi:MAG TPA: hypothetical protein VIG71_03990 [Enteractinococcus sp.]
MLRSHHMRDLDPPTTPALVVDVPLLDTMVGRFQSALETHWPHSILSYSFKTNSLPWLITHLRDQGVWAEVVSDTEYELALALGYAPECIIFNGPVKGREQLRLALQRGSVVNLDAKREVTWAAELARELPGQTFAVGLRVNWDLESYCPGESTAGKEESRFGFNPENGELDEAIAELSEAGIRIAGLHMHRNSFTQSLAVFRAGATVASEIVVSRGLDLDWLDIGGGFFGSVESTPTFDDYVSIVRETVEGVIDPERTCLIVEPGGSLVAVPLEFHASVLDVKDVGSSRLIVTDASRTNIDPLFRRRRPFEYQIDAEATETMQEQVIGGFTCMEDDRLMKVQDAPILQRGDRITFYRVGGYTMCYQPTLFIEFAPPVYARTSDKLFQVRSPMDVEGYLRGHEWSVGELSGSHVVRTPSQTT